ncbi:MAG: hypothetical protein AB8B97_01905 [Granulosicoccus sp.]
MFSVATDDATPSDDDSQPEPDAQPDTQPEPDAQPQADTNTSDQNTGSVADDSDPVGQTTAPTAPLSVGSAGTFLILLLGSLLTRSSKRRCNNLTATSLRGLA